MRIATIVVTYNRKELLLENIIALQNQTYRYLMDIIVIDNASTDGTKEALDDYVKRKNIIYIHTNKNIGGAGGFQLGVKYARDNKYDYIWLMDDDSIPLATALEELVVAGKMLNNNYGFLASKVLWKDNSICKMNIPKISIRKKVVDWNIELTPIVMSSFVSMFIPVPVVEKVGLPIKEFFIWADDIEYSRRISRRYNAYLVSKSVVVHKTKNNEGSNIAKDDISRLNRYELAYRNELYIYKKEGVYGIMYDLIRIIYHISNILLFASNNKILRLCTLFKGVKKGLSFNPKIEF